MSWYCLVCTAGPMDCSRGTCIVCDNPGKPYQCGKDTVSEVFKLASAAADQGQSAKELVSVNLADAEATLNGAMDELKRAKVISSDIEAAKRENPELEGSLTTMFEIADGIVNRANSAFLTKKIMKGARNARNRTAVAKGGKRRRNKSKKNRRDSRK